MTTPPAWKGEAIADPLLLHGTHVRLEPLAPGHALDLFEAGRAPEIWSYIAGSGGPFASVDDVTRWIASALGEQASGLQLPFAIIDTAAARAIGTTSYFFEPRWPNRTIEIGGTWLSTEYWRTIVNTECKYLLLRHAFEALGAERIELMTDARNVRSQHAIERLGARREGTLRANMIREDGYIRDSVYYSIVRGEWPAIKAGLEQKL
jgi:RimJ/RimL family protein N-acetyltransferase